MPQQQGAAWAECTCPGVRISSFLSFSFARVSSVLPPSRSATRRRASKCNTHTQPGCLEKYGDFTKTKMRIDKNNLAWRNRPLLRVPLSLKNGPNFNSETTPCALARHRGRRGGALGFLCGGKRGPGQRQRWGRGAAVRRRPAAAPCPAASPPLRALRRRMRLEVLVVC